MSVNNSQRFVVRGAENGVVAKEKCEVEEFLFFFPFKMAAIPAYLYADINNPAKRKNLIVQEKEKKIAVTFPEAEEKRWYPVHRGWGWPQRKRGTSHHSGGKERGVQHPEKTEDPVLSF